MTRLTTVDNAEDSLARMARELKANDWSAQGMKAALWWGWHTVRLLVHHRLSPARDSFDQWFWTYLEAGEADLDVDRDARWGEREQLSLLHILDILSETELEILDPQFYQGWQDRTTRCRTLRQGVHSVLGVGINGSERERLLLLLAAYHRLLRVPGDVELDPGPVRRALPALLDLVQLLVDSSHGHSPGLLQKLEACRSVL